MFHTPMPPIRSGCKGAPTSISINSLLNCSGLSFKTMVALASSFPPASTPISEPRTCEQNCSNEAGSTCSTHFKMKRNSSVQQITDTSRRRLLHHEAVKQLSSALASEWGLETLLTHRRFQTTYCVNPN